MNKSDVLLPLESRVTHFDGGASSHGLGTIIRYNGVTPNEYMKTNFKDAVDLAGQAGLLGGLLTSAYDGQRCPYVVKWDHGYTDVYEPTSVRVLTAESYEFSLRDNFRKLADDLGYKIDASYGPHLSAKTQLAWELYKLTIASRSKGRKLEFEIND